MNAFAVDIDSRKPFPTRLMQMLDCETIWRPDIITWGCDGHIFQIVNEQRFLREVLPRHGFKASKIESFHRNVSNRHNSQIVTLLFWAYFGWVLVVGAGGGGGRSSVGWRARASGLGGGQLR